MSKENLKKYTVGWIGTGRMGYAMVSRLLDAGCDCAVYNRTKSKAEPLAEKGAKIVDNPSDLADRDIVFTMIAGPNDLREVVLGSKGVLSVDGKKPQMVVDCSSVDEEASAEVRAKAKEQGVEMLAAPVSGNAKVVKAGKLSIVASGPQESFDKAEAFLDEMGRGVSYVGEGELARYVKICHNVLLGVTIQNLAEITVLAEKGGVPRHQFLDFINKSVMGSLFTAYKTPGLVNLDFSPTFTPPLLRKDLELGLSAAHDLNVPMPTTQAAHACVTATLGKGYAEEDFSRLITVQAELSGLELKSENKDVPDGLSD